MGNIYSTKKVQPRECKVSASWKTVSIATERVLEFDPNESQAVCVGVGQLEKYSKVNDGGCSDNDSQQMKIQLIDKFGFPEDNVTLLNQTSSCATKDAVLKSLKERISKVGGNGLLLFSFSGHGIKNEDNLSLATFDYNNDQKSVTTLSTSDICNIIETHCNNAKYFLVILDCCHAGKLLDNHQKYFNSLRGPPWYLLASCQSAQQSIFFPPLGHGFFSYFLLDYFSGARRGAFPIQDAMNACVPLCEALCVIMRPCNGTTAQTPQLTHAFWEECDSGTIDEVPSLLAWTLDPLWIKKHPGGWLLNFWCKTSTVQLMDLLPASIEWLQDFAEKALGKLRRFLCRSEMITTVLALMSQSLVVMFYRHLERDSNSPCGKVFQSNYCILSVLGESEVLTRVEPSFKLSPEYAKPAIQYYIKKLSSETGVSLRDPRMRELVDLLTAVHNYDLSCDKLKLGQSVGGGDQTDGHGHSDSLEKTILASIESIEQRVNLCDLI